jgi:hypothetical protein
VTRALGVAAIGLAALLGACELTKDPFGAPLPAPLGWVDGTGANRSGDAALADCSKDPKLTGPQIADCMERRGFRRATRSDPDTGYGRDRM